MPKKVNERGFREYGTLAADERGQSIRVAESSEVGRARVWIFVHGEPPQLHLGKWQYPTPYLSVPQAKRLVSFLQKFINENGG